MLTKTDIAAIRQADDLTVHLSDRHPNGLIRLIKRKRPSEKDPFAQDVEHILSETAQIDGLRGQAEFKAGQVQCFAMVSIYHNQHTTASCILKTLRVGDELTFAFCPDAHTNGYVAMSGLHADVLYLYVRREGKTVAKWELDSSICPENSARMIRGVPNSDSYARDGQEARKVA